MQLVKFVYSRIILDFCVFLLIQGGPGGPGVDGERGEAGDKVGIIIDLYMYEYI